MKNYSSLPKEIKLPTGEILKPYVGGKTQAEIIATCKQVKAKYRKVRVLANTLKGRTDLHGKPYTGSFWIFTNSDSF